jgi:hypothetical protein
MADPARQAGKNLTTREGMGRGRAGGLPPAGCVDLGHGPTGMSVSSHKSLREIQTPENRGLRQPAVIPPWSM